MKQKKSCREERVRAFVLYADTTGFTTWAKRAATSPEDKRAYNLAMYEEFVRFEQESGLKLKYLCDGVFAAQEMETEERKMALNILKRGWDLQQRMEEIISKMRHPRPHGFRIRVAFGMVSKIFIPPAGKEHQWRIEYVGESPVLGDRLLEIEREIGCICTIAVREILKDERGIKFETVKVKGPTPRGIDDEDLRELLSFSFDTTNG